MFLSQISSVFNLLSWSLSGDTRSASLVRRCIYSSELMYDGND